MPEPLPIDLDSTETIASRRADRELVARLDAEYGRTVPAPSPLAVPREGYPSTPSWIGDAAERQRQTAAHRDIERTARAARAPVPTATPAPRALRPQLTAGNLVAGARAEADGALLGWSGQGKMRRASIAEALVRAGLPVEWSPKSKSATAHAGAAVERLSAQGYVVRRERGRRVDSNTGERRAYTARWLVGHVGSLARDGKSVGEDFGVITMTVTLRNETLHVEAGHGHQAVADGLTDDYRFRLDGEVYEAGEVTEWLRSALRERFRAIPFGGVYYVHNDHLRDAERLCESLATAWGTAWMLPALPVATTQQLRAGLSRGVEEEAAEVLRAWTTTVGTARAERRSVGVKAAATALARATEVAERVREYALVLGRYELDSLRDKLGAVLDDIRPHLSAEAQRGAMLELD